VHPYTVTWDAEAVALVPTLCILYVLLLRVYPAPRWRIACFAASQALILGVFISPLETIALHYLLTAHLLQNVVLAEWAPALFMLALPPRFLTGLTHYRFFRVVASPFVALPVWLLTYFAWHLPWAYDAALEHPSTLLHLEHACYFTAGVLFWWPVFQQRPHALSSGQKTVYIFSAFVLAAPLGLLLSLLPSPIYSFYETAPRLWGLSAITDQQIAGITMSAEEAIVFFCLCSWFFMRFLQEEERRDAFRTPVRAPTSDNR
jgi:cytochrome c oxidase assembly factor CtaG